MLIKITPIPKPRMVRSDRWAKRPAVLRYYTFCDELRLKYKEPMPEKVRLVFHIEMPKSWSNKKREAMFLKPHKQRPDIDNLTKAVLDALCEDDSFVWDIHATKVWNYEPCLEIVCLDS